MNRATLIGVFLAVVVVSCGPNTPSPNPTSKVESAGSQIPESTEEPVPPTEEDGIAQTIISAGSSSYAYVGGQEIEIVLDPNDELDTSGVEITIVDLGSTVLLQTIDPYGRFLPSVEFIDKPGSDAVNVVLPQIDAAQQWAIGTVEIADARALMTELIETVDSVGSLNELLNSLASGSGLVLLIEPQSLVDEGQLLDVYRTPAHATVLAISQKLTSGEAGKLAAPAQQIPVSLPVVWRIPFAGKFNSFLCSYPEPLRPEGVTCDPGAQSA